ncbi:MAG: hypothetical protein ABUL46_00515, partial [Chitinophaga rupis]
MQKLLIILSFFLGSCLAARSQTLPPAGQTSPPAGNVPVSGLPNSNTLSNYQKKVKARKDSALNTVRQYVNPGPQKNPVKRPGQDTLSASKRSPGLALTDTPPDPETLIPSLDHGSCKGVVFIPQAPEFEKMPVAT